MQKSASIQPRTSPSKFGEKLFNIIHSCPYSCFRGLAEVLIEPRNLFALTLLYRKICNRFHKAEMEAVKTVRRSDRTERRATCCTAGSFFLVFRIWRVPSDLLKLKPSSRGRSIGEEDARVVETADLQHDFDAVAKLFRCLLLLPQLLCHLRGMQHYR